MTTYSLTGTGAAVVPLSLDSAALTIQIEGSWTGTIDFEASIDGTTWEALPVSPILPSGAASVTSTSANGTWAVAVNGLAAVQILGATITGTATVVVNQSTVSLPTSATGTPVSGTVTANEGTAGAIGNAWYVRPTDGTNVPAVKAASTAAVAADPSAVVQLSPNMATPSTFSQLGVQAYEVKATGGNLKSVHAANRSASALYLQAFNATTATGSIALQFQIPAGSQILIGSDFLTGGGWAFSTAIYLAVSTTAGSYAAYSTPANIDLQGTFL